MNDQRKTKKQLLEELELERERSIALQEISNRLAGARDTDEVLDLIVNEATRLVNTHAAYIRLLDGNELVSSVATEGAADFLAELSPVVGIGEDTHPAGQVMSTKKPLVVEDVAEGELMYPALLSALQKHGLKASVLVPLLANDRSIGVLVVLDKRIRRFTRGEVSLLQAFADQASLALEKARLLNEAEREKERSDALYRVSNLLAGAHDTDEVLDLIVHEAARLGGLMPVSFDW